MEDLSFSASVSVTLDTTSTSECFDITDNTAHLAKEVRDISGSNAEYVEHAEHSSTTLAEHERLEGWRMYPFNLPTYNPLTEWGEHYTEIFQGDSWPPVSRFELLDVNGDKVGRLFVAKCSSF